MRNNVSVDGFTSPKFSAILACLTFLSLFGLGLSSNDNDTTNFNSSERTAVIISGQLRSANLTILSAAIVDNAHKRMFGPEDPKTCAGTILKFFLEPLAEYGGVDVFMYLSAHPQEPNSTWDGDPWTYNPSPGDTRACQVFSEHPIFNNGTGNKFFCLVEEEVPLMNIFTKKNPIWETYTYHDPLFKYAEQVLTQLYGMYQGNLAAKEYAVAAGITYKYKARVRPDVAFVRILNTTELKSMNFGQNARRAECKRTIYHANTALYRNSAVEDFFNFGLASDMDHLLDRYFEITTQPFVFDFKDRDDWKLEDHLKESLLRNHESCQENWDQIWMVILRRSDYRGLNKWQPDQDPQSQWVEMTR
jgi:hypothetical protein